MAPSGNARYGETLTGGSPSARAGNFGVVSGYVFKLVREQTALSQERLAETLGVDKATVQGWESGRRPLSSVQTGRFMTLRKVFLRLGTNPVLLAMLDDALEADAVIGHAIEHRPTTATIDQHPLANWVFTRATTHMIAWSLNGTPPAALPDGNAPPTSRRGPARRAAAHGAGEGRAFCAPARSRRHCATSR